jgi:hypothetical protein
MKRKQLPRIRVHLNGEAPRLGSGHRTVEIVSEGPKWVIVRDPRYAVRHKFRRAQWNQIIRKEIAL